jgi:hypothetical protein
MSAIIHVSLYHPCSFFAAAYLVEVKHQIQLAHVAEELIQHFDKEVYGF